ncbi:MAG: hypothetical protein C0467_25580 [Planctomycetaceae bacterium]|nr:hypothetical protein [Planctomycetaceae bacterium]
MRSKCVAFLGIALLLTVGCSNESALTPAAIDVGGGDEGKHIAGLVDRMSDQSSMASMKASFATGTSLNSQAARQYAKYRYDLKGQVTVNDSTATATIGMEPHAGGKMVEKPWTFVKEGTAWKIKSAPLP